MMKEQKDKSGLALTGAVVGALAASLCCILPLVAIVLGVSSFAASEFFARWRPYLLAVTFGLLALGFYLAYRPRGEVCETGSACARTTIGRWNRAGLWLVTLLVVVFAAFPYYSGWIVRAVTNEKNPAAPAGARSVAHVVLSVQGMDCPVCAAALEKSLSQIAGVRYARVNFQEKRASLDYDPRVVDASRFVKLIRDAGFKAQALPGQETDQKDN